VDFWGWCGGVFSVLLAGVALSEVIMKGGVTCGMSEAFGVGVASYG